MGPPGSHGTLRMPRPPGWSRLVLSYSLISAVPMNSSATCMATGSSTLRGHTVPHQFNIIRWQETPHLGTSFSPALQEHEQSMLYSPLKHIFLHCKWENHLYSPVSCHGIQPKATALAYGSSMPCLTLCQMIPRSLKTPFVPIGQMLL